MKETELAAKVVAWLTEQHWEIYQEVQFHAQSSIADIVAVRHRMMWIIECKMSFGLSVLEQATAWPAHFRSVAVPRVVRRTRSRVARDFYHVGVIEVGQYIYEDVPPPLMRQHHPFAKKMMELLTDDHKTHAVAGSRGGSHITPYKQTMHAVRKVIAQNPGCTIRFLFDELGQMHYSSPASARSNLLKSLQLFEKDWCRVDDSSKPFRLYLVEK